MSDLINGTYYTIISISSMLTHMLILPFLYAYVSVHVITCLLPSMTTHIYILQYLYPHKSIFSRILTHLQPSISSHIYILPYPHTCPCPTASHIYILLFLLPHVSSLVFIITNSYSLFLTHLHPSMSYDNYILLCPFTFTSFHGLTLLYPL